MFKCLNIKEAKGDQSSVPPQFYLNKIGRARRGVGVVKSENLKDLLIIRVAYKRIIQVIVPYRGVFNLGLYTIKGVLNIKNTIYYSCLTNTQNIANKDRFRNVIDYSKSLLNSISLDR